MCDPVTASVALGAAQGGMQFMGQQQAARAQEKAQRNATIAEQQRYLQQVSAQRLAERQETVAAAQAIQRAATKSREARATARVSAGEAGVAGVSVDSLINDLTRKQAEYNFSVQQQMEFTGVNRSLGLQDAAQRSRMNLLSINRPIPQPNLAGSVISGISTGLSAYAGMSDAGLFEGSKFTTKPAGGYKLESAATPIPSMTFTLPNG